MVIKSRDEMLEKPLEIDLAGPNGNAYWLLGQAKSFCDQIGQDPEPVLEDMKAGDYDHLIEVFDEHFGDYVTLYR